MALSLLEGDNEAAHAFLSAIHLKRDFVFPYIQLSKLYSKKREIEEAQKALDRGQENSPNSPQLKKALAKLHMREKNGLYFGDEPKFIIFWLFLCRCFLGYPSS